MSPFNVQGIESMQVGNGYGSEIIRITSDRAIPTGHDFQQGGNGHMFINFCDFKYGGFGKPEFQHQVRFPNYPYYLTLIKE